MSGAIRSVSASRGMPNRPIKPKEEMVGRMLGIIARIPPETEPRVMRRIKEITTTASESDLN